MSEQNLKQKTAKGLAWSTINTISNRVISFAIGIILARLLSPSDFGLTAIIAVFVVVLNLFAEGGLSMALIQKESRTEQDLATVFWYNLVACWLIYILIFIGAPFLADFYEKPILCSVARISSLTMLITPFGSIQHTLFSIRLDFKTPAIINLTCSIVSGSLAILMAFNGYGVWALVWQGLVSNVISVIWKMCAIKWWPKTRFSWDSFKNLFGFSSRMIVSNIIWRVYENISALIIGKIYTTHFLGIYNRAYGWSQMPASVILQIINGVAYPVLSKIQGDIVRFGNAYRKMIRMTAFLSFPIFFGLFAVASPLTLAFLTEKWEESIPLLRILCFYNLFLPINIINECLLLSLGRSDIYMRFGIYIIPIYFVCMLVSIPFGIEAFCVGQVLSIVIGISIKIPITSKLISVSVKQQILDILPIFLNCCVMLGVCMLVQDFCTENISKLICAIVVGGIYYVTSSLVLCKKEIKDIVDFIHCWQ